MSSSFSQNAAANIPGHRCGTGTYDGAYQFVALDSTGDTADLTAWAGKWVRIRWIQSSGTGVLYFGFFATQAAATTGFDDTTSGSNVDTAPDWIERGPEDLKVPASHPFLRVQASGVGNGRCIVRIVDEI